MTISFVDQATGTPVTGGVQATIPAGTAGGDRIVAVVGTNSVSGYSHVTLPGWQLLATSYGSTDGGSQFGSLYTREAAGGDAGSSVLFQVTPNGSKNVASLAVYRGTITTPVVAAVDVRPHVGAGTTGIVVPQLNVDELPAWLVSAVTKKGGTGVTLTPPAGFAGRAVGQATGSGAIACQIADDDAVSTGATSVADWGSNTSSSAATGFLVVLTEGAPPDLGAPTFHRWTVDGWVPPLP